MHPPPRRWAPAHAVVCAAGGWAGGSAADSAASDTLGTMVDQCLRPAMAAAHVAASTLAPGGALVLLGSSASLAPTPGMLAYGAVKAATHHMVASLAAREGGLPAEARVYGVVPTVLDTPANRRAMGGPGADTSAWTPMGQVGDAIVEWCGGGGGSPQPRSGSLVEPVTVGGVTTWREHDAMPPKPAPLK